MYTHAKFAQLLHVNLNTLDNYIHIYWRNNHTKCTFTSVQIELTYARASSKYTDGFFGSLVLHSSNQPFNAKIYNIPEHYKTVTHDWHSAGKYRKQASWLLQPDCAASSERPQFRMPPFGMPPSFDRCMPPRRWSNQNILFWHFLTVTPIVA